MNLTQIQNAALPVARFTRAVQAVVPSSKRLDCELAAESIGSFQRTRGRSAVGSEPLHYSDRWSQQVISVQSYPDGAMEQILEGSGHGNVLGEYSVRSIARLKPRGINTSMRLALFIVKGETHSTAMDGSVLSTRFSGRITSPLNDQFAPAAGLSPFSVNWRVFHGTGRFLGATGHGMFTGSGTSEGQFDGMSWGTIWMAAHTDRVQEICG
jgi:hypothetical protein